MASYNMPCFHFSYYQKFVILCSTFHSKMELPLGVLATLGITLQEWNVLNMFAPQYLESTLGDGDLSMEVKVIMLKVNF